MLCSKCKQNIDADSKFCSYCGNKIENKSNSKGIYIGVISILSVLVLILGIIVVKNFISPKAADQVAAKQTTGTSNTTNKSSGTSQKTGTSKESENPQQSENSQSSQTSESSSENSKSNEAQKDTGYFTIEINGKKQTYMAEEEFHKAYDDTYGVILKSDKYSDKNSFYISLPSNVGNGDKIVIDSADTDNLNFSPAYVSYTNSQGESYSIGYPDGSYNDVMVDEGTHDSSKAIITIDKWEGMGGYATGTIEGKITLTDNEVVTFKNGRFEIKIKSSGF